MTAEFYDQKEHQKAEAREDALFSAFPSYLQNFVQNSPGLAAHLSNTAIGLVKTRGDLDKIPVLYKADLMAAQAVKKTTLHL